MVAHLRRHPVDDFLREFFFAGKQLFLGETEALVHATPVDQDISCSISSMALKRPALVK